VIESLQRDTDVRPWRTPGPLVPRRGNAVTRWVARTLLRVWGWKVTGTLPNLSKFVITAAPHTSGWDFPIGVLAKASVGLRISFLGKDSLFKPPLGWIMRWQGGKPVDRSSPHGMVAETVRIIGESEHFILALAPEGTRRRVEDWKTGFYHVALGAGIPVVLGSIDFATRVVDFGPTIWPSGDIEKDMDLIQTYYRGFVGKNPTLFAIKGD